MKKNNMPISHQSAADLLAAIERSYAVTSAEDVIDVTPPSTSAPMPLAADPAELPPPPPPPIVVTPRPLTFVLDKAVPIDRKSFPNPPSKDSGPKATIPNVRHLLSHYRITVRYDVIKKKLVITMPGHTGSSDNYDNTAMAQIESLARLNGMSTSPIPSIVAMLGDCNPHNPVAEWIESRDWDGIDRLPEFYATLTEREGYPAMLKETLMRRWMISTVAALFEERFSCRGVLTLQGGQGIGKTKWTSALVPDPILRQQVVRLGHHLDAGDKDSQTGAITNWVVEIGELDGSLRRDIAKLKGFLTLDQDKIRRPYARTESEYARRTVFCATVNDSNFLVDPTGNSRFWTIAVESIDYNHDVDMQQLFAQVLVAYRAGEPWWLTREEEAMLAEQNAGHRTENAIRERVLAVIDLDRIGDSSVTAVTSVQVLRFAGIEQPTNPQIKDCVAVLRELMGEGSRIRGQQKWRVPIAEPSLDADAMPF